MRDWWCEDDSAVRVRGIVLLPRGAKWSGARILLQEDVDLMRSSADRNPRCGQQRKIKRDSL
jgi:hypothetical protein